MDLKEIIEEVCKDMCEHYCKYYELETQSGLDEHCENCPLNRLF